MESIRPFFFLAQLDLRKFSTGVWEPFARNPRLKPEKMGRGRRFVQYIFGNKAATDVI